MNRRSRHLGALPLALFALGVACSPFARQPTSPSAGGIADMTAALDRRVSVEFAAATLPEVLEELSRQAGVRVYADGPAASKAAKWTSDDWLVNGKLTDVRLEVALLTLADPVGLLVDPRADGIALATARNGTYLPAVTHVIPPALLDASTGFDEQRLADVVQSLIDPESWFAVGGVGEIEVLPGALVVVQTPANQRSIASFIAGLERCRTRGEAASSHDPPYASPPTLAVTRALDAPFAMPFDSMSLPALLEHISDEHGVNIVTCDPDPWYGPKPVHRFFVEASDEPLGKVLRRALAAFEIEATVFDGVLVLDSEDDDSWSTVVWSVHPMPADVLETCGAESLLDVVFRHIEPETWSEVGGPSEIALVPGGIAVAAPRSVHAQVAQFLDDLTRALDPTEPYLPPTLTAVERTWEASLDKPVTLDLNYGTVHENLIALFESCDLPRPLFDETALSDAGITLDLRWGFRLDGVPLRTAWSFIRDQLEIDVVGEDETLVITSTEHTHTRCYRLPSLLNAYDSYIGEWSAGCWGTRQTVTYRGSRLTDLVTNHVNPDEWDEVGGIGSIAAMPPVLIVTQPRPNLARVEHFLAGLSAFNDSDVATAATGLPLDTPAEARLHAALREPAEIDATNQPLDEVLEEQAVLHGFEGRNVLDVRGLNDDGLRIHMPVSAHTAGVPLAKALDELLRPVDLDWTVRDGVLFISTVDEIAYQLESRFYPLPWSPAGDAGPDISELVETITHHVASDSWSDVGGPGEIDALPRGLIVTQSRDVHLRVSIFLEQLSQIVTGRTISYRPAYAVGLPDPPDMPTLVQDVRALLRPHGTLDQADLLDILASIDPWGDTPSPVYLAGTLVIGRDADGVSRMRRLLTDEGGCLTRILALRNAINTDYAAQRDTTAACRAALADVSPLVRHSALTTVRDLAAMDDLDAADPSIVDGIVACLEDSDVNVRLAAIDALGTFDPPPEAAAGPLARLLLDDDRDVRITARQSLIHIGPRGAGALPVLRERITDESSVIELIPILHAIGPGSAAFLAEFIEPRTPLFSTATDVLESMGADAAPALPAIRAALRGEHNRYQFHRLCKVLVAIGPAADPSIPDLVAIVDRDDDDAQAACITLGQLARRAEIAVPALDRAAGGSEVAITRQEACLALARFGAKAQSALPTLRRIRDNDPIDAVYSPAQQAIAQIEQAVQIEAAAGGKPATPAQRVE